MADNIHLTINTYFPCIRIYTYPAETPREVIACTKWYDCYWRNWLPTLYVKFCETAQYPANCTITSSNLSIQPDSSNVTGNTVREILGWKVLSSYLKHTNQCLSCVMWVMLEVYGCLLSQLYM